MKDSEKFGREINSITTRIQVNGSCLDTVCITRHQQFNLARSVNFRPVRFCWERGPIRTQNMSHTVSKIEPLSLTTL